jgi:uncharacterized protein (DUF2235 family)
MTRLFVCCDGTWNAPTDVQDGVPVPTNVVRFYNALADVDANGIRQLRYYHPGVGTEEVSWLGRAWAGSTGAGLARNIKSAYYWLAENFRPGDEIYLLGFSRGAFTVRSLSGFLSSRGLCQEPDWSIIDPAYDEYRKHTKKEIDLGRFRQVSIHFLGVWDTVGALGIPPDLPWLMRLGARRQKLHNTDLSPAVTHAFQALAIDESRRTFSPALWTGRSAQNLEVVQTWFPGVHADVGGGYKETGLSDLTLRCMIERAANLGAAFRQDMLDQIRGDHYGVLHDSRVGVFKGAKTQPRCLPNLDNPASAGPVGQDLHLSVFYRRNRPPIFQAPYRVSQRLRVGQFITVPVYARDHWNWTGVYVEPGDSYEVSATGEWVHWLARCDPDGYPGVPWLWPLSFFRRYRRAPWMCLVGAVADFANPNQGGQIRLLDTFRIGSRAALNFNAGQLGAIGGYLYAFANDRDAGFDLNRGSVQLTIRRI